MCARVTEARRPLQRGHCGRASGARRSQRLRRELAAKVHLGLAR